MFLFALACGMGHQVRHLQCGCFYLLLDPTPSIQPWHTGWFFLPVPPLLSATGLSLVLPSLSPAPTWCPQPWFIAVFNALSPECHALQKSLQLILLVFLFKHLPSPTSEVLHCDLR